MVAAFPVKGTGGIDTWGPAGWPCEWGQLRQRSQQRWPSMWDHSQASCFSSAPSAHSLREFGKSKDQRSCELWQSRQNVQVLQSPAPGEVMWTQEARAQRFGGGGAMGAFLILLPSLMSLQPQPEATRTPENLPSPSAQLSLGQSFVQSHFQAQYR